MQTHDTFPCLVSIFRSAANWCSAFWLFSITSSGVLRGISFPAMLAAGLLSYLLFRLFLLRPRTVPAIAALGFGLFAGSCAVLGWRFSTLSGFFPRLIAAAAVGTLVWHGLALCREPIPIEKSLSGLDASICFTILYLGFQNSSKIGFSYTAPLLASVVLGLLAVLSQRLSDVGGPSVRGRFRGLPAVAAVMGAVAVLLLVFLQFAAGPVSRGVVTLLRAALKGLKALGHIVYGFLLWLISLFPAAGNVPPPQEPSQLPQGAQVSQGGIDPKILMLLGGVLLCAVITLAVYFLFRFRKKTFGGSRSAVPHGTVVRGRISLKSWVRRILNGLRSRLCFLEAAVSMRGSPQFLYWQLVRAGSRLGVRKQPAETPSAFLRRLEQVLPPDGAPEPREALEQLAGYLAAALYAQNGPGTFPNDRARLLRRAVRKLPRRSQMS